MTHAASFASGGMVTRITSSSAAALLPKGLVPLRVCGFLPADLRQRLPQLCRNDSMQPFDWRARRRGLQDWNEPSGVRMFQEELQNMRIGLP